MAAAPAPGEDGRGLSGDRSFHVLGGWDAEAPMKLFRERLLARLVERRAISQELARKLVRWTHPGQPARSDRG